MQRPLFNETNYFCTGLSRAKFQTAKFCEKCRQRQRLQLTRNCDPFQNLETTYEKIAGVTLADVIYRICAIS